MVSCTRGSAGGMAAVCGFKPLPAWSSLVTDEGEASGLAAVGVSAMSLFLGETGSKEGETGNSRAIAGTDFVAVRTLTGRRLVVVPSFESTFLRAMRVGRRTFDAPTRLFPTVLLGPGSGIALTAAVLAAFARLLAARTVRDRSLMGALFGFIQRFCLGGRGYF